MLFVAEVLTYKSASPHMQSCQAKYLLTAPLFPPNISIGVPQDIFSIYNHYLNNY